ncbi:MAG: EscN/YscN/HrcN family type III secretion system ATPase, partial [Opitutaceae bacterium]
MTTAVAPLVDVLRSQVRHLPPVQRIGAVTGIAGLIIESEGPNVGLGDLCLIRSTRTDFGVRAEVVGFREQQRVLLMPLGDTQGLHVGCEVAVADRPPRPRPGPELLGRVLDALGRPFDGLGLFPVERNAGWNGTPPHPLRRQRIHEALPTGVRAIDTLIPVGRGQRLGLFAGSGVGKSTLLGMIARGSAADVVVVGLVGERGREVREFIEKDLGPEGLRRSVVVVATSDSPAPLRLRAAFTATAIAEAYREQGKHVLLMMDSVT